MKFILEGFLRLLGICAIIYLDYHYQMHNPITESNISISILYIFQNIYQNNLIPYQNGNFPRENFLLNSPLFSQRKQSINFLQESYQQSKRPIYFSIVIATFERAQCFKRVFEHLIKNRPNNTEIIVSDDASRSPDKISLLNQISNEYKDDDVYVIQHSKSFGAFHTKLDGFLFSVGEFIMSIDDDDYFDDQYFIEMASTTIKLLSNNSQINFVIALDFPYISKWVKLPYPVDKMIAGFHNHVDFAFRRNLLCKVDYPPQEVTIVRDDAPLMIPLYIQTNNSQIYYYQNHYRYLVDRRCPSTHQSNMYRSRRREYLNGFDFLIRYLIQINRTDLEHLIKASYN